MLRKLFRAKRPQEPEIVELEVEPKGKGFTVIENLNGGWKNEEIAQAMNINGATICRDTDYPKHMIIVGCYAKEIIAKFMNAGIYAIKHAFTLEELPFRPTGC